MKQMSSSENIKLKIVDYIGETSKSIGTKFNLPAADIQKIFRADYSLNFIYSEKNDVKTNLEKYLTDYLSLVRKNIVKTYSVDDVIVSNIINNTHREEYDIAVLSRYSLAKLKEICRVKKLKYSGTKDQLLMRITGNENIAPTVMVPVITKVSPSSKKRPPTAVISKIKKPSMKISKNSFGNYEHKETSLVFNVALKKVIGVQEEDGTISPLTDDDIQRCKQYKFDYVLPKNLDKYNTLNNVSVKELDDITITKTSSSISSDDEDSSSDIDSDDEDSE